MSSSTSDAQEFVGVMFIIGSGAALEIFELTCPIVLGHESSGIVVGLGSAVNNVEVGDRVAIEPGVPCRHCEYCRSGRYNLCADTVFAATPPHHGTLSKLYNTAADFCYRLPENLSMEDGALCEPVAVGVQICRTGNVRAGQTVLVMGCGPIGLMCQSVAKAWGAKTVIEVDLSQKRLQMAKNNLRCADAIFEPPIVPDDRKGNSDKEMEWSAIVAEMIKEEFGMREGPDIVLEATGAQSCIQIGINVVKKGGTYGQAGMRRESVVFPITTACIRDLTIRGSIRYTTGCYPMAIDLITSGKIDPKRIISHRFPSKDAKKAFNTVYQGGEDVLKVMIEGVKA